tara:strand:- start:189 stop:569 length:381 start_codon:yes stop_codon:yes gene_type:complete
MKLNLFYKIFFLIKFFLFFYCISSYANENIDAKVKKLTLELRCMTCQNQSVYDSEADFSNDIKKIVRSKFEEGKSEKEIKIFLANRYGEYILFKPLMNYKNLFLWAFPFILLVFSLFFIVSITRKK